MTTGWRGVSRTPTSGPSAGEEQARNPAGAAGGEPFPPPNDPSDDNHIQQQALQMLALAQRTAEEHITTAQQRADKVQQEARTSAERIVRDAQAQAEEIRREAEKALNDAEARAAQIGEEAQAQAENSRRESQRIVSDARARAAEIVREAQAGADNLKRQAELRYEEMVGNLAAKREALQQQIKALQEFDRDYRARLVAFMQGQLRALWVDDRSVDAEPEQPSPEASTPPKPLERPDVEGTPDAAATGAGPADRA
jgi:cell division septum initiation protein DivIVA